MWPTRGVALAVVALAVVAGVLVAACGAEAPTSSAPPLVTEPATGTPFPAASAVSASPVSSAPAGSPESGLIVDDGLLAALPAEVDDLVVEPVPEAAQQVAADPNLRRDAQAVAVGMVVGLSAETEDFAVASIVQLDPDVFDAAFYGAWRDSYDEAACERAGGVSRRAETEIGGRPVFIATCAGGPRLYHVHLADPDRIVSITSVGERRLGELLVEGLEP